jgi:glycine/D-amino acid oxidase-like deaminating enzyme
LPPPAETISTDVAIFGSGIAGLTAAWRLNKLGTGISDDRWPAAVWQCGRRAPGDLAILRAATTCRCRRPNRRTCAKSCSTWASSSAIHGGKPTYDERYILHAPEERLLFNGQWQDGFIPTEGVPPGTGAARALLCRSAAPAPDAWQRWQARLRLPHRGIVAGPGLAGAR